MDGFSRRAALQLGGTLAAGVCAGCLTGAESTDRDKLATASFFVLGDFASKVADDATQIDTLVPVGQHGHGWEPGPSIQQAILDAAAFVYMGEGFQLWADNVVQNLERDAPELVVIEARHGISLLEAGGHDDEKGDHDAEEDGHGDEDNHDTEDGDHDHASIDPHFWLDPQRAAQAVDTIAAGLTIADSAQAERYRDGATSYADALAELDSEIEETLSSRTRDTVLVAGHDAFQYLADRYGFEVHALSSLSPDTEPTPQDVREAQAVIEEHGIEHVLAPVFESDRAARQLVEETDATDLLPITSIPTASEEWMENDWGYIDIMREVNLPTLREALGA
ncbi:metal ABC transporter substrate-binding protein [Haladaptatus sp. DJG-WS-42]|uniref:metal ABC transporter substrate-binding protein n=1 Tax=Haladaptatus sp. DJG-WS-42 TaxID=3120516 RepID=UPI0030D12D53